MSQRPPGPFTTTATPSSFRIPHAHARGDVFIPPNAIQDAMHGDHVLAKIQRLGGVTVLSVPKAHLRILDRAHPTVVGLFRYGASTNVVLLTTFASSTKLKSSRQRADTGPLKKLGFSGADEPHSIQAHPASRRTRRAPSSTSSCSAIRTRRFCDRPRHRILGRPGELGVDTRSSFAKHHLHTHSPPKSRRGRARARTPVSEPQRAGREDFRHLSIVTIDGETRAISTMPSSSSIAPTAVGTCKFTSPTWRTMFELPRRSTRKRAARAFRLLPRSRRPHASGALSNGMCSLKPHEDRLVMSALMEFDAAGHMKSSRMDFGVIRSASA